MGWPMRDYLIFNGLNGWGNVSTFPMVKQVNRFAYCRIFCNTIKVFYASGTRVGINRNTLVNFFPALCQDKFIAAGGKFKTLPSCPKLHLCLLYLKITNDFLIDA